uniref:ATPase AAA-type core domain-containing protein n=1 Tax=Haptolina ericina TaxID=156174 RepID=A0A7S3AN18_9EUKA
MGATVIFLDEIDALATSREGAGMHEASRRTLSVLLRKLDGFETNKSTVLIAATNRPEDLDAALLSRFELSISFPLPDTAIRREIVSLYARHLSKSDVEALAKASDGASGRDIRDICEAAERRWAARRVRGEQITLDQPLPPQAEYDRCLRQRMGAAEEILKRKLKRS